MDRKYKVGGYVKLAKLWERAKDAAVAYHSSYYAEKFKTDSDKKLVGVYIDITGNKSRRMILSYDQRIMTGQYPVADLMGYRHTKDGRLVIEPEEAKTVRFIFLAFIQGYNYDQIAAVLTQKKRSTLRGRQEWNGMMVASRHYFSTDTAR